MSDKRIFISYARSDGRDCAARLRARLKAEGLGVWQDLPDMAPGRDWWLQIEAVLRTPAVEHLVLVLTDGAIASGHVRDEWRLARQEGKQVTQVIDRSAKPDVSGLPKAMTAEHRLDPETPEHWHVLVSTLRARSTQERVPFMAADRHPKFVSRPERFAAIKSALLDETGNGAAITTAPKSAGGFGKTWLARELCHDPDIRDAFYHGVLWTTLGEAPGDPVGRINELSRVIRKDADQPGTLEAALRQWRELTQHLRCLVVVDDVWRSADLDPFLQGGPHCARLITTRDAGTLPEAGGRVIAPIEVDRMTEEEAIALLARSHRDVVEDAISEPKRLAAELGYWALLLDVAHGRILTRTQRGIAFAEAVREVLKRVRFKGISGLDSRTPKARHEAAIRSLDLSFDALAKDEGEAAADCLLDLAPFAEDTSVPVAIVEALWAKRGFDAFEASDLLARLHSMSFLSDCDLGAGVLRIHDTIRNWMQIRLGEEALMAAHDRIATACRELVGDDWPSAPDYVVAYLPMHLAAADRDAEANELVISAAWIEQAL